MLYVIIVKLLVESVLQRAYVKITVSRMNSLPFRFIYAAAHFLVPGAFPATISLKALEKGYDRSLKSCRGHKEKTASALSRARLYFSRGAMTATAMATAMATAGLLVIIDERF